MQPIRIRADENDRRPSEPPPEPKRSLGEAFNDLMSAVTEKMRANARQQLTKIIQDMDRLKPDINDVEAYESYKNIADHLTAMRSDIINGGWKGAAAARQVLSEFSEYSSHARDDRYNLLPRLQNLIPSA